MNYIPSVDGIDEYYVHRERLLDTIINTIDVAIIACDKVGQLTLFNETAIQWHGLGRRLMPNENYADYYNLYEADGETLLKTEDVPLLQLLYTGFIEKNEIILKPRNQKARRVKVSGTRIHDEQENVEGAVIKLYDITNIQTARNNISKILSLTESQNYRLRNFAHIVSHNLRSHSGNFEMLLDIFLDDNPELKDDNIIKLLLSASENLKETISHLNEVALINSPISKITEPLNLRNCVVHALNSIMGYIEKSHIKVYNNISADFIIQGIPAYVDSIILNFTTNAIKYSNSNGNAYLKFNAIKKEDYIELWIRDNGVGIDLERNGAQLFGMYKTFHGNKDAKGIGLYMAKNQIEAMGGKVDVESTLNKGTVFKISFKYEKG